MEKKDLADKHYSFRVEDGYITIIYNDRNSLEKKEQNIEEGASYYKNLADVNVDEIDLQNIESIDFIFWEVSSEKFDLSNAIDDLLVFYNKIQTKAENDVIFFLDTDYLKMRPSIKEELIKKYGEIENPDNLVIKPPTTNLVSKSSDFFRLSYIKNIDEQIEMGINDIKESDLSSLEKVMACYFVSQKLFNNIACSNKGVNLVDDIYAGFDKGYITCVGYSSLFKSMVDQLGIECSFFDHIVDGAGGHSANLVSIKDEKYNIDGTYVFDTTLDATRYYDTIADGKIRNSFIPDFSSICFFGLGKEDALYVKSIDNYNFSSNSISYDNLLTCLYNVNQFIYGENVNTDILAKSFVSSINYRNALNKRYTSLEDAQEKRKELYSYASDKLAFVSANDLDSLFEKSLESESSKKESHM